MKLRAWLRRRRVTIGLLLLAGGSIALLPNVAGGSGAEELTYGVSAVDGDPGIAVHWVVCPGVPARVIDIEGYWGGSQLPTAVPVLWQIRSDAPAADVTRVETYVVGETPPGFYETVALRTRLPRDRIAISAPPGDASARAGMSFRREELPEDAIYRGGYQFVSPTEFAADGAAYCRAGAGSALPAVAIIALGLGGALIAGLRHPVALLVSGLIMASGTVAALAPGPMGDLVAPRQQPATAFAPGQTGVPPSRDVLLDMSPATMRAHGGLFVARFVAPDSYAFAVSCSGSSIHVGETSEMENGATGGRQLIGCNTGALVNGAIADHDDRDELVEIVVIPNGVDDWRVVVVAGPGEVGPFDEP